MADLTHPLARYAVRTHRHATLIHAADEALMVDPSLSAAFDGVCMVDGSLSPETLAQTVTSLRDGGTVLLAAVTPALLYDALDQIMLSLLEPAVPRTDAALAEESRRTATQ